MRKHIPELDGLRALSVLVVITAHMHQRIWHWASGFLGVTVFFVLSGYLITSLAMAEELSTGKLNLRAFYIRRTFRIFPMYYLVLGVYCFLIFFTRFGADKRAGLPHVLPYLLTYFQEVAYGMPGSVMYQSWSLGVEEKFYIVWPVLAFVLAKRFKKEAAILLWISFVLLATLSGMSILISYGSILIGCALALFQKQIPFARFGMAAWPLAVAILLLQTIVMPHTQSALAKIGLMTIYGLLVAAFVGVIVYTRTVFNIVLSFEPLVWIGKVSYGIYLVHILCLNLAEKLVSRAVPAYLLTVAISIAVASVLYWTFEKPLINVGRSWASRQVSQDSSAFAAAASAAP
jgi:peptidoglycan/LPS O-acetylase OafA/YrhL